MAPEQTETIDAYGARLRATPEDAREITALYDAIPTTPPAGVQAPGPEEQRFYDRISEWVVDGRLEPMGKADHDQFRVNGFVPGTQMTETLDIDGVRFAASIETMETIDRTRQDGVIDPEEALALHWYEARLLEERMAVAIDYAIRDGDLIYLHQVQWQDFAINGDTETPIMRTERERVERFIEEAHREGAALSEAGIRIALRMEPQEAIDRGLVSVEVDDDGDWVYVATPQLTHTAHDVTPNNPATAPLHAHQRDRGGQAFALTPDREALRILREHRENEHDHGFDISQ